MEAGQPALRPHWQPRFRLLQEQGHASMASSLLRKVVTLLPFLSTSVQLQSPLPALHPRKLAGQTCRASSAWRRQAGGRAWLLTAALCIASAEP